MSKQRSRQFKQMALEVATRNPERFDGILKVFSKYDGMTLNDETILNMYTDMFIAGEVKSKSRSKVFKERYEIENFLMQDGLSHKADLSFPLGYQSAFARYLRTLLEFGFVYAEYNKKFHISEIGQAVIDRTISLSEAFSIQIFKHWRKSPYRRVLNDFNYFKFILKVIVELEKNKKKLSYSQLMLSLFSENGDVDEFLKLISKNKIGSSLDKTYSLILRKYSKKAHYGRICKQKSCFSDYGNSVFRVLRLTGFINVDFNGAILISINEQKKKLIDELINMDFDISEEAKDDKEAYFAETGYFDSNQLRIIIKNRPRQSKTANYINYIPSIIKQYKLSKKFVIEYLLAVANGAKDNRIFKFIERPEKFEFLVTLFLYYYYGDKFIYQPNFIYDGSGLPYSHAPGYKGDIELYNKNQYWLLEVTLLTSKIQQINFETTNLFNHITTKPFKKKYLTFIAPVIHKDTMHIFQALIITHLLELENKDFYAIPQSIDEFIADTLGLTNFQSMEKYLVEYRKRLKRL